MYLRFFMPEGYGRLLRELTARFCREVTGSLSVPLRSGKLLPFSGIIPLGTCVIRGELIGMRRKRVLSRRFHSDPEAGTSVLGRRRERVNIRCIGGDRISDS